MPLEPELKPRQKLARQSKIQTKNYNGSTIIGESESQHELLPLCQGILWRPTMQISERNLEQHQTTCQHEEQTSISSEMQTIRHHAKIHPDELGVFRSKAHEPKIGKMEIKD